MLNGYIKLAVICGKLHWNPIVNMHLQPMQYCARKPRARYANGEVIGKKCNGYRKSFKKRILTYPSFLCYRMEGESFYQHVISFWLWAKAM